MTARKVRNQNSPRKRISYGRHKLVLVHFKEEPEVQEKPKCGIKFVWKGGKIVGVESQ